MEQSFVGWYYTLLSLQSIVSLVVELFANNDCRNEHYTRTLTNISQCAEIISLPLCPFVRGEVLSATSSPPHLIFFSILLCFSYSSSSLPPLLPSSLLILPSQPRPPSSHPAFLAFLLTQSFHLSLDLPRLTLPSSLLS